MTRPSLFDLYNNQQILETKMNSYKAIVDNEEFSKMTAMKKILGYSDADVEENFKNLAKEKCLTEVAEYWSGKVSSEGPAGEYDIPPIPIKGMTNDDATDSGDSGDSGDGSSTDDGGSEDSKAEAGSDAPEEPQQPEEKEAPAPTFGLG